MVTRQEELRKNDRMTCRALSLSGPVRLSQLEHMVDDL